MNEMNRYRKISITGDLGSGKSTVCRLITEQFGFNLYSIGVIQRALAQKYDMTTLEFNQYMETHPEIDEEIDNTLAAIGKRNEDMILDSRMAWHFVPDSFKVYLTVDIDIAADRIITAERGCVETYTDHSDAKCKILQRKCSENQRYMTKYNVDCSNLDNYDLVINTTYASPHEIADLIMSQLDFWTNGVEIEKFR